MTKKFIISILIITGLIIGASFGLKNFLPKSSSIKPLEPTPLIAEQFKERQIINLTKTGFSPASTNVNVGTLIQWINLSEEEASVNSLDHPTHELHSNLNLGLFPEASSLSLIFDSAGTYKYHDHLHPERVGIIIVK